MDHQPRVQPPIHERDGSKLSAESREAIRDFVYEIVGRWAKVAGLASVLAVVAGFAYFIFALPAQVANSAVATGSLARTVGLIEGQIQKSRDDLNEVEVQLSALRSHSEDTLLRATNLLNAVAQHERESDFIADTAASVASLNEAITNLDRHGQLFVASESKQVDGLPAGRTSPIAPSLSVSVIKDECVLVVGYAASLKTSTGNYSELWIKESTSNSRRVGERQFASSGQDRAVPASAIGVFRAADVGKLEFEMQVKVDGGSGVVGARTLLATRLRRCD